MKTIVRHYRIERREIAFLRFILEGYDGAAILTTLDAARGTVVLKIAPGCLDFVLSLVASLSREIRIEPMEALDAEARGDDDR